MKHLLKGIAVLAVSMLISIALNVFCNMNNVELNSTVTTMVSTICALLLYYAWIRNEKN